MNPDDKEKKVNVACGINRNLSR